MKQLNFFKPIKVKLTITGILLGLLFAFPSYAQLAGLACDSVDYYNYGLHSTSDANTIQYDNYLSGFHSTIARNSNFDLYYWGENASPAGKDVTTPTKIDNNLSSILTGTPLIASIGSNYNVNNQQFIVLTTDGLFVWGKQGRVISDSLTTSNGVNKVALNVPTYNTSMDSFGLPTGVTPTEVKMMFVTYNTVSILTCGGVPYVLSLRESMRGVDSGTSYKTKWCRVKTAATGHPNLDNVVALRGSARAMFALTSDNKLYTWGAQVYLGDNTAVQTDVYYATQMTLPASETANDIKMISSTSKGDNLTNAAMTVSSSTGTTYYLLYGNGHLWSLGDGSGKQLGDWTTNNAKEWVQPKYPDALNLVAAGDPMDDIAWVSGNEHDATNSVVAVINEDGRIWDWGSDSRSMLGRGDLAAMNNYAVNGYAKNPGQPANNDNILNPNDTTRGADFNPDTSTMLAVNTGGHTIMAIMQCEDKMGYMGHAVGGSAANHTNVDDQFPYITFTSGLQIIGAQTTPSISIVGDFVTDDTARLCSAQVRITLTGFPDGGTFSITSGDNLGSITGSVLTFNTLPENTIDSIKLRYSATGLCGAETVDTMFYISSYCTLLKVQGTVWIDPNENAILDPGEGGTNASYGSYSGLYANLVGADGKEFQSVPVSPTGKYSLSTKDSTQIYSISITKSQVGKGVAIPANQYILQNGWAYTGNNDGTANTTTTTPYTIIGIDFHGKGPNYIIDNRDFGLNGINTLSGTVYQDADGLVDGNIATNYTSNNNSGVDLSGVSVVLIDQNNKVFSATTTTSGAYSFTKVPNGSFSVLLTTATSLSHGDAKPSAGLITGWVNTGEYLGTGNGNDGTVDGELGIEVSGSNITNANFGVEQLSTADDHTFTTTTQPDVNEIFSLDGGTNNPELPSGTDPEDGTYTGASGVTHNPKGVQITSLPTNGELYYNSTLVTASDVSNSTLFTDPTKFSVKLTGTNYTSTEFKYAYVDGANVVGTPATYTMNWLIPLPITLVNFTATNINNGVQLDWTTASEQNNKGFLVERSADAHSWNEIGFVQSQSDNGTSNSKLSYSLTDGAPIVGNNFYRLKQVDYNGQFSYSKVREIFFEGVTAITIHPNPTKGAFIIDGLKGSEQIAIYNTMGRKVIEQPANQTKANLSLSSLENGTYFIVISDKDGQSMTFRIVKQ